MTKTVVEVRDIHVSVGRYTIILVRARRRLFLVKYTLRYKYVEISFSIRFKAMSEKGKKSAETEISERTDDPLLSAIILVTLTFLFVFR